MRREGEKAQKPRLSQVLLSIDAMGVYLRNSEEINLLSDDAHLPVGSIGSTGSSRFVPIS
ncbi:MAG: hypothetical protein ACLSDJ_07605 [Butyricimonas faecihominis]